MTAVLALAGCTTPEAAPSPSPSSPEATRTPPPVTPTATPTPSATQPDASSGPELPTVENISCDTMLDPAVDARLRAMPLVPYPKEFGSSIFGFTGEGPSISCPWGPPDVQASEASAQYTWVEFRPGERDAFLSLLAQHGYTTEPADRGEWLVGPEEYGIPPMGMLVTETWFASALTRDEVSDIVWTH